MYMPVLFYIPRVCITFPKFIYLVITTLKKELPRANHRVAVADIIEGIYRGKQLIKYNNHNLLK